MKWFQYSVCGKKGVSTCSRYLFCSSGPYATKELYNNNGRSCKIPGILPCHRTSVGRSLLNLGKKNSLKLGSIAIESIFLLPS